MADKPERQSVLGKLKAGATIADDSGTSVAGGATSPSQVKPSGPVTSGTPNGAGTGAGTGASNGAGNPAEIFNARKPVIGAASPGTGTRPVWGTHPKNGERVEIDYSQEGAGPDAPFGYLPSGKVRTKRPRKKSASKTAGTASAAKAGQNITAIADAIKFAHMGIASVTGHSHWTISDGDAQAQADALTDLQAAYGVDISPEQAAWIKALTVIAIPTGMRTMASMQKVRTKNVTPAPVKKPEKASGDKETTPASAPTPPGSGPKGPQTPSQMILETGGRFEFTTG